jgi:hypothetical protein
MTETTTTEKPRTDGGQFAPTEPLTGRAELEAKHGFVPFKEEKEEPAAEELTAREAAKQLVEERGTRESEVRTVGLNLPKNVTLTLDQAAKALSDERAADRDQAEIDDADRLRKEVDKLRSEGEEQEEKPAKSKETKAEKDADPAHAADSDEPDLEKVLSHPKVKEALDKHVSEAETTRQRFSEGLDTLRTHVVDAFRDAFPDLARLPFAQFKQALIVMSQREPARFQQAMAKLQRIDQMDAARQQVNQQNAARQRAEFQKYAAAEDTRFADFVKGESNMGAIEAEIPGMLKELGVDPAAFLKMGNESKFLRSAAAQKILVDAAKYRMLMRAPKARPAVPHVQRPGTAQPRVNSSVAKIDGLRAKAHSTGKLRDFANLLTEERRARR